MLEKLPKAASLVVAQLRAYTPSRAARWLRQPDPRWTLRVIRRHGGTVGEGSRIKGALTLDNFLRREGYTGDFSHLVLEDHCYVGDDVYVDLADRVTVGAGAMVSARAVIVTHQNAHRSPWVSERFPTSTGPVTIGSGAWLGVSVTVLPGVTIGDESVVAAGAVVVDDVPARSVVAGVPAKSVRDLV